MKIGRNDPCPCGSGKKYKVCCALKEAAGKGDWTRHALWVIAAILVLGIVGFVYGVFAGERSADGRVWSAEHGHWHAADGSELGAAPVSGAQEGAVGTTSASDAAE